MSWCYAAICCGLKDRASFVGLSTYPVYAAPVRGRFSLAILYENMNPSKNGKLGTHHETTEGSGLYAAFLLIIRDWVGRMIYHDN